jgi:hypothetical protein
LNVGGTLTITAPSCASPGNCAVGGTYEDGKSDDLAFVASERNGTWGKAQPIPGLAALATDHNDSVSQVSCGAPGDCAATGIYNVGAEPNTVEDAFHVAEKDGTRPPRALRPARSRCGRVPSWPARSLVARYPGSAGFTASASDQATRTVVR